jgi:CDGSH-type Zn-finger protein
MLSSRVLACWRSTQARLFSTPRPTTVLSSFNDNSDGKLAQKETVELDLQGTPMISVCRCWKSAKFPICDGAHKVLNSQHKSKLGPLVVKVKGYEAPPKK